MRVDLSMAMAEPSMGERVIANEPSCLSQGLDGRIALARAAQGVSELLPRMR